MRTTKPLRLGLLTRPYVHRTQSWLGVAQLMYFHLDRPDTLLSEIAMWKTAAEQLGANAAVDAGIPKVGAEVLLPGARAYPPVRPAETCPVRVQVGSIDKTLYVIGDRRWRDHVPTAPGAFDSMPISWERAFGGEGFAPNPRGLGFHERYVEGAALPNIEHPARMIRAFGDRPEPASFDALDLTSPERSAKAGTYDQRWLDTEYPGFAADIDWRYFSLASSDQRADTAFVPGAEIVLTNLHPSRAEVRSRVPSHVARCVVRRAGHDFEEVVMRPTTLWIFAETLEAILVHHGAVQIAEDDARDVEQIIIAADGQDAPRALSHFVHVMEQRTDRSLRAVGVALDDAPLLPPGHSGLSPDLDAELVRMTPSDKPRQRMWKRLGRDIEEIRTEFRDGGMDPAEYGPEALGPLPPKPSIRALAAQMEEDDLTARAGGVQAHVDAELAKAAAETRQFYEEEGADPTEHEEMMTRVGCGPPTIDADEEWEDLNETAREVDDAGQDSAYLFEIASLERFREQERAERDGYREAGHLQRAVPEPTDAEKLARRASFLRRLEAGEPMREVDFTWADLRGLDLRGRDLAGAWLESADLSGSDLEGASLRGAVLARARLSGTKLVRAQLERANLGRIECQRADLSGADLRAAILTSASFVESSLRGADLSDCETRELRLERCDLTGANLASLSLLRTVLAGSTLDGARLDEARLMELSLAGCSLRGASISSAILYAVDGDRADFTGARLVRTTVVHGSSLRGAIFAGADLSCALLRGVPMKGVDLRGAQAREADFSEADLSEARLDGAHARNASFVRTDLRSARLWGADLKEALLTKADLRGADLRETSLYGADMALIRADTSTAVHGSYQIGVRARPYRRDA